MEFERIADALSERGWAIVPGFLCEAEIAGLTSLAESRKEQFKPAGIGRGNARLIDREIRSDLIHWLDDGEDQPDGARSALARLDNLKTELNRSLFLGLKEFEGHLAVYPPGARYQKHVDNFRDASPRALSCVIYLNQGWAAEDEGKLRLYDRADADLVVAEVEPRAGTLAVFLSREIPHEVLPTTRERISFTGWFRDR